MSLTKKTFTSVAVVAMLAAGVSACGDKDDTGASSDKGSTSTKTDETSSTSGTTLTKDNFAKVIGAAMIKAGSTHVEMKGGTGAQTLTASGDQQIGSNVADSAIAMSLDAGGTSMEIRLVDQVVYLGLGDVTDGKFVKVDLKDKDNPLVAQLGQFTQQADLARQFEVFQDSLTGFEQKGAPKKIDGVEATPYDVTVDTAELAKATGADASTLPKKFTYTFFVGEDDLVRRMVAEVSGVALTLDYTKWGEPVEVKAPADSEITDQDLGGLMGGTSNS